MPVVARCLSLILALAACGSTAKGTKSPHHHRPDPDEDDDPEEKPSRKVQPIKILTIGDAFEAPFPGAPIPVHVPVVPNVVARDQQPVPGARVRTTDDKQVIHAVGAYVDADGVKHLAAVLVQEGARASTDDVHWFENAGQASSGQWRVWGERFGHGNLVALHDGRGELRAVRYLDGVQRTRPVAIDPAIPMLLVERGDEGGDRPSTYELLGFTNGSIELLLEIDAASTAISVAGNVVTTRTVPELSGKCTPNDLATAGCLAEEHAYTWRAGSFVASPGVEKMWRLVEVRGTERPIAPAVPKHDGDDTAAR